MREPERPRRVVFITEAEPFFLAKSFRHLLALPLPGWDIAGVMLLPFAMTHRHANRWKGLARFLRIYGFPTAGRFAWAFLKHRWRKADRVDRVFASRAIPVVRDVVNVNAPAAIDAIRNWQPDLIVSLALHQILHQELLALAPLGCINVHLGALPDHRGPAPVFWALHDGDGEAGVTVHQMSARIDVGNMLAQRFQPITTRCFMTLMEQQRLLGMDVLREVLENLSTDQRTVPVARPAAARYQRWPRREDVKTFLKNGNCLI